MLQMIIRIGGLCKTIAKRYISDQLMSLASALTFTTLLALVPLLTLGVAIFSVFPVAHSVGDTVSQFILDNFVPTSGAVIQKYLSGFISQAGKLSLIGTIALVITAIFMMITIEQAFNNIWKTQHRRLGVASLLKYWAVLSLAPIFIGLSVVVTSYFVSLPLIVGTVTKLGMKAILLGSLPWIFTMLLLWLLYVVVPNCKVPVRYGFIGAVIATILFELIKKGFVIYINNFATYSVIYGAVAILPIFLLWVYLLWLIVMFGALIANVLTVHGFATKTGKIDGFSHAFLWLGFLWRAQQQGKSMTFEQLCDTLLGKYVVDVNIVLRYLLQANFILMTSKGEYILARDFSLTTLAELYDLLPWKLPVIQEQELLPDNMQAVLKDANLTLKDKLNVSLSALY